METKEKETVEGVILRKEKKERGPVGDFIINDMKFTCWSETIWAKFDEGDEVIVDYITKENQFNGRTFKNHNISSMKYLDDPEPTFSKTEKQILQDEGFKVDKLSNAMPILKSDNLKFKLGGLYYRVKSVELELIEN
jgi:hypothetical protein